MALTGNGIWKPDRDFIDNSLELSRRISATRYTIVRIGCRLFTISRPRKNRHSHFYGEVKPLPRKRGRTMLGKYVLSSEAMLRFRLTGGRFGQFNAIEVPQRFQRRGWARDMVFALLEAYPDSQWRNGRLNEKSGPLFMKLREQHPCRIASIERVDNQHYAVGEWGKGP